MIPEGFPKPDLMLSKLYNPSCLGGLPSPPPEKEAQAKSSKGEKASYKINQPHSLFLVSLQRSTYIHYHSMKNPFGSGHRLICLPYIYLLSF